MNGVPAKDSSYTNVNVKNLLQLSCGNSDIKAKTITACSGVFETGFFRELTVPTDPIPFTPAPNVTVLRNSSQDTNGIVSILLDVELVDNGTLAGAPVLLGSIPEFYGPAVPVSGTKCELSLPAITIAELDSDGTWTACPTGFPYPAGTYRFPLTRTYPRKDHIVQ